MEASKDKIYTLGRNQPGQSDEQAAAEITAKTNRDMGRVALFVSILAVILLTVFFFGVNQNMTGLTAQVKDFGQVKQQLAAMQQQVAALENLPAATRKMVLSGMLAETAQKLAYVQSQVPEGDASARLAKAIEEITAAQVDLAK
jgi:Tfp pilus assembly protein PilO